MKNKFLKKLVALTLAGCLALGDIPAAAFASEQEIMTESSAAEEASEQTATELSTELTAEATTESAAESKAEPPTEAAAETTAEATTEPAAEPETELTTETVAEYEAEAADELDMSGVETIPLLSEKVQAVQKMIDALPSASALNEENMEAVYEQTETAYDAYFDLSADEQAQITGAEKFAALFGVFNAQIDSLGSEAATYSITINDMTNGTVTADMTSATEGESVTLTVAPADRYALEKLLVNGENVTLQVENNTYTFNMSAKNVSVTATFVCMQPAFTVTQNGASTTYTVNTGTTFLSFWGQQNSNYTYSFWIRTRENKTERIASDTAGEVKDGDAYEMVAYVFSGSNYHKLHVYKDLNVNEWNWAAYCEIMQIHSGKLTVYHSVDGKEKSFELTAEKHKLRDFAEGKQWYYNGNALDMSLDMPPMEMSFTARDLYSIITTAATNGTVTAGSTSAVEGAQVRLTLTPKTGYEPEGVTVTDAGGGAITATAGANNTYTFTMPAGNVSVTATFKLKEGYHTITVDSIAQAGLRDNPAPQTNGTSAGVLLNVETDYRVDDAWLTDMTGTRLDVAIQITVSEDVTYLNFTMPDCNVIVHATTKAANLYSVTLNNTAPGGTIVLPENFDADNVEANSTVTLTITPAENYELDTLSVTDAEGATVAATAGEDGKYTFTMPDSNVTVSVTFARVYTVTINAPDSGTVTVDKTSAAEGETVKLTVAPVDRYALESLFVNGTNVTNNVQNNSCTFIMPAGDVNVSATFVCTKPRFTITVAGGRPQTITLDEAKTFYDWIYNNQSYEFYSTGLWKCTCKDGTTKRGWTQSLGTIADGDAYELIAYLFFGSGEWLFVYGDCDINELLNVGNMEYSISSGSLTVHHTVDGEEKDFVLTCDKTKLSDFANGARWCVNGVPVDMSSTVPLETTAYTTATTYTATLYNNDFAILSLPDGKTQYAAGETVTVLVDQTKLGNGTVLEDIIVKQLVEGNSQVSYTVNNTDGSITFTMPANNVEVQAVVNDTYYVTLNTVGGDENCTASFSGVGVNTAYDGRLWVSNGVTFFTMTITAGDDYKVGSVEVTDANGTTELTYDGMVGYQYNNITSDVTVTVTFVRAYTVTLHDNDDGILSLPNGDKYAEDETVTVKVDESNVPEGKVINLFNVCLVGSNETLPYTKNADSTITFKMPENDVRVQFQLTDGYYLTLTTVGAVEGCSAVFADEVMSSPFFDNRYYIQNGQIVRVNITCAEDYEYTMTAVESDGEPVTVTDGFVANQPYFTMPASNVTVTVTFSRVYQVSKKNPFNGTIELSKSEAKAGDEVTVTLAPFDCYTLKTLTVDGVDVTAQVADNVYTFTMPDHNVAVNAEFDVIAYSIQGATGADGKAKAGDTLTVTPYSEEYIMWFIGEPGAYSYAYSQTMTVKDEYAGKTITCKIYEDMNFSPNGSGGSHVDFPVATLTVQVESNGPSYVITIPSSVSLNLNTAQSMTITASNVQNLNGQAISVAVTSENGGMLKNGENEISYAFAQSLNFVENGSQNLALTIGDTSGKPAGTYTDTLNFSVSLTDAVAGE